MHLMQIHNTDGRPFYLHAKSCTDGSFRATLADVRAAIQEARRDKYEHKSSLLLIKRVRGSRCFSYHVPSTRVTVSLEPIFSASGIRLGCHAFDAINGLALLKWAGLRPRRVK